MKELVEEEEALIANKGSLPSDDKLITAKKDGFSDKYLSQILEVSEDEIRNHRIELGVEEAWEGVHVSGTENSADVYKRQVLKAFLFNTCKAEANWNMKNFVEDQVELIRKQVGDKKVLLALSGGVDSSVVAALLIKAIGKQLVCVHVNHGLMRKGESESVVEVFKNCLLYTSRCV